MSVGRVLLLVVTLSLGTASAWAGRSPPPPRHGRGVPEIDPAGLGAAVTLLTGSAFLVGSRIKRRRRAEKI
jgi:hypothetical protein